MPRSHDEIFRLVFSTREAQQDLIRLALPRPVTRRFRMDTVRDVPGEVSGAGTQARTASSEDRELMADKTEAPETVQTERSGPTLRHDSWLRPGQADLLLSVQTVEGSEELVYVVVEHKSYPDKRVAVQLLRYVAGLWHRWRRLPLPVIHPVVLYHGPEPWSVPTELVGLHRPAPSRPSLGGATPGSDYPTNLRYHLLDLSRVPPEHLEKHTRARALAGLITLKYIMRHLSRPEIRRILMATASNELPSEFRRLLWRYLFSFVFDEDVDTVLTEMETTAYTIDGGDMRSMADELISRGKRVGLEEGREEGREEGKGIGQAELLARLLDRRFDLTSEERQMVEACRDRAKLEMAADALADSDTTKERVLSFIR